MELKRLSEDIAVAAQITAEDVGRLRELGFRSIVGNRPDGESAGQPSFEEIAAAARAMGLEACHIPVRSGMVADEDAEAFRVALEELPKPVVAYCRTGTRSAALWCLAEAGRRPVGEILERTREAGYDMTAVAERLRSIR